MQGYCFGCKGKQDIVKVVIKTNAKGGKYAEGICAKCDRKLVALVSCREQANA